MKKWLQHNIVYFIAIIILVTLFIQAYWNITNYEANKVTVNNEVQAALNRSVDTYYTNLAKSDLKSVISNEDMVSGPLSKDIQSIVDTVIAETGITEHSIEGSNTTTTVHFIDVPKQSAPVEISEIVKQAQISGSAEGNIKISPQDSINGITGLATKIIISLSNDSINFKKLTKYLNQELKSNNLDFKYALSQISEDGHKLNYGNPKNPDYKLLAESRSAYLPTGSQLHMYYPNINYIALQESLLGISLSFLFTIAIITSLLYLLKMIREQKQIVLSKNDFISNISHELKTPIATSLSALEAIQHFNASNDTDKTQKYMGIASQQLHKLNVMVEKILDTASLESDQLALHKESTDIVPLLNSVIEKQQLNTAKQISFVSESNVLLASIDVFHFENVINNIIENAIKYGGNTITVTLLPEAKHAEILVVDDGNTIDKSQRNKIFDKFYRVPTSNRHDVKGYGIGLYYSKNIIEKHGGKLTLLDDAKHTVFKITVPYA